MNLDIIARATVSIIVLLTFLAALGLVLTKSLPAGSEQIANVMLGYLGAMATGVVSYWVGSSAGSAKKTELLAMAQPVNPNGAPH